jgi:3'-phosphoadenosine 5'-phosphosulfate sulfotransferase (PAPS reductase)/FAD synthetase
LRSIHSKIVFDGIRAEESPKRRGFGKIWFYDKHKFRCFCVHPIYRWTRAEVEKYLKERNLKINPVYKILGFSAECFCGAYSHRAEFERLKAHFPDFFERLIRIEEKIRTGYTYIYHRGRRVPLSELKKQKTLMED